MSVNQAAEQLLAIIQNRRFQGENPGMTALLLSAATSLQPHFLMSLWTPLPSSDSQNSALQWIWAALNPSHETDLARLEHSTVQWASMKVHWWLLEVQSKPQSGNPVSIHVELWALWAIKSCGSRRILSILDQSGFKKDSALFYLDWLHSAVCEHQQESRLTQRCRTVIFTLIFNTSQEQTEIFLEIKDKVTANQDGAVVSQKFFLIYSSRSTPHLKSLFLQYS